MTRPSLTQRLLQGLGQPWPVASLVVFRVVLGLALAGEAGKFLSPVAGHAGRTFVELAFPADRPLLKYLGFHWLPVLPSDVMTALAWVMLLSGIFVALGLFYRAACVALFLTHTYFFLVNAIHYLNHNYLLALLAFLMIFLPAQRGCSLDALRKRALRDAWAPAWGLMLLRFQLGVVYFYAGVAKINPDWLAGQPLQLWLARQTDFPLVGHLFTRPWMVYFMSYAGLLLDLLAFPALLWPRSRAVALALLVVFHLANARLFSIGVFPWFMIAALIVFVDPYWWHRLMRFEPSLGAAASNPPGRLALAALTLYVALQLLLPLRHWLYPGNVAWTYEGSRFAWRMKIDDRRPTVLYHFTEPATGKRWTIDLAKTSGHGVAVKIGSRPDLILQKAHHLAAQHRRLGGGQLEVRAEVMLSINGRDPMPLTDPRVDLMTRRPTLWPCDWIIRQELPPLSPASSALDADAVE